jgi:FkbM family methyltransferase
MRLEDVTDYFRLRSLTTNPWEICCFRKGQKLGQTLVVKFRNKPHLYLRGGMSDYHMFHRIFLRDEYRLAAVPLRSWECVVDLGANVGIFSSRVSELARKVFSYEPFSGNKEQLEKNLKPCENITVIHKAVAGKPGMIRLFMPESERSTGSYSSFPDLGVTTESYQEVPSITLNQIFSDNKIDRCDLLKIDIEGQEYEVLHSTDDEVLSRTIRIHGEYHNVEPDNPITRIQDFAPFLNSKGYEVEVIPRKRKPNHGLFYATQAKL